MADIQTQQKTISRRRFRGTVTRAALPQTITVRVERFFRHPRLKRVMRVQKKFLVHDEKRVAKEGDQVVFEETRPLSKRKRWQFVELVKKTEDGEVEENEKDDTDAT